MKTKIVIIGAAMRATDFIDYIKNSDECELVAICDISEKRMKILCDNFNLNDIPCYLRYEQCLKDIEHDAVMIFTPDGAHSEFAVAALESEKFVFLEKPMEITKERCQNIIDADKAVGGKTYIGFNLRHSPVYKKVKELQEEGVLGKILTIQAEEFYNGGRSYFRRWNRFRKFSGGLWITKGCHDFDYIQWIAGEKPLSVAAFSENSYYKKKKGAASHCSHCQLEKKCPDAFAKQELFSKNELALLESDGPADICLYNSEKDTFDHGQAVIKFEKGILATYTLNVVTGYSNRKVSVGGTKAYVEADIGAAKVTVQYRDSGKIDVYTGKDLSLDTEKGKAGHGGADQYILPDFLAFVRKEKDTLVSPEEAYTSVKIGLAARESCDKERVTNIL